MTVEQSKTIPSEKGWPLLGVLPKLMKGDPFEYLKNIMLEKGDFVQLNMGPQPVYLVSHPDYLQRILRDNFQNYRKPDMFYNAIRAVTGNGLGTSSGDVWLRQRRMIQPHLHRKQLANLFSDMTSAISDVLDSWKGLAENNIEVEFGEKMGEISSNVIARTMFGHNILQPAEVTDMGHHMSDISKYVGETLYSVMLPKWFPIPGHKRFEHNLSETRAVINRIIAQCRDEKETSASLIQMLIGAVDEESHVHMNEQQLFDEVMTIYIGGYETVATGLTWLAIAIQNHPEVLAKLYAEIDQVLGGRVPSFEDVSRLTYTRQVFMETLRMYTVGPFLPRALNAADQLGAYALPADALLLVFYHGVHHNPRVWENPETFDPDRFAPERMAGQHPFAYMPFSGGPRKCAGDDFALLEGPLAVAMILQRYKLTLSPNQTFPARLGSTMHPKNGLKVTLSLRAN